MPQAEHAVWFVSDFQTSLVTRVALLVAAAGAVAIARTVAEWIHGGGIRANGSKPAASSNVVEQFGCRIERTLVANWPAELLWFDPCTCGDSSSGTVSHTREAQPLVIVIPGFPGCAQLYADFLGSLVKKLQFPAVAIAWCGHHECPQGIEQSLPSSLEEHGRFMTAVVQYLRNLPWVTKVVLIGQSLGSRLAAQALTVSEERCTSAPVAALHLLCPVLEDLSCLPRAQMFKRPLEFIKKWRVDDVLQGIARAIPLEGGAAFLQFVWWLRGKTTTSPEDRWIWRVVLSILRLGVFKKALALVMKAMLHVQDQSTWLKSIKKLEDVLAFHFSIGDKWTPEEVRARLKHQYPKARHFFHKMPHGIVANTAAAHAVAAVLAADIEDAVR